MNDLHQKLTVQRLSAVIIAFFVLAALSALAVYFTAPTMISLTSNAFSYCLTDFHHSFDCWCAAPLALVVLAASSCQQFLNPRGSSDDTTIEWRYSQSLPCLVQSLSHGHCSHTGRNCDLDDTGLLSIWCLGYGSEEA